MTVASVSASSEIEVESARASGREHADNRLCRGQGTNDQKTKERQSRVDIESRPKLKKDELEKTAVASIKTVKWREDNSFGEYYNQD